MSTAFDVNRLGRPTQRKFCASWVEILDQQPVHVLPTVAWELTSGTAGAMDSLSPEDLFNLRERLIQLVNQDSNLNDPKRLRWRLLVIWWCNELLIDESPYSLNVLDDAQSELVTDLVLNFDKEIFPRMGRQEIMGLPDARIIAEAAVLNHQLLITSNMAAVNFAKANDWLLDHAHRFNLTCSTGLLHDQDEYIKRAFLDQGRIRDVFKVALSSAWPLDEHAGRDEVFGNFIRMLKAFEGALLRETANALTHYFRFSHEAHEVYDEVKDSGLPVLMRDAEMRHPFVVGHTNFAESLDAAAQYTPQP